MKLKKIPSIVKNVPLSDEVQVGRSIVPEEGLIILVEALDDEGKNNVLEFTTGRLGKLIKGDVVPAVLGKRRALKEFAGDIPQALKPGDELYWLCESGLVGEIVGVNERWGTPMKVKVLGALLHHGKTLNIKHSAIPWQNDVVKSAPIVAVLATCMDSGKTTLVCKLAEHFRNNGLTVMGAKLTGVAFMQDPFKMKDNGLDTVMDFVDAGLPSTCGNAEDAIKAACGIITELNNGEPDLILAEFGDGIIGEYNVASIITHPSIKKHVVMTVVAANDLMAAWGAKKKMTELGFTIDMLTGPVANSHVGVEYIEHNFGIPAESNQHAIPKTIAILEKKMKEASV
ncbi:MAG: hypothetical protein Q8L37_02440 [Candidatus Gottesmanbacteria bacterium]|nr:hypothetical protein [Candidatus Gottesmanbacteria bacterium]